jgi:hypothetical protein
VYATTVTAKDGITLDVHCVMEAVMIKLHASARSLGDGKSLLSSMDFDGRTVVMKILIQRTKCQVLSDCNQP